jgi:hypothetical protein
LFICVQGGSQSEQGHVVVGLSGSNGNITTFDATNATTSTAVTSDFTFIFNSDSVISGDISIGNRWVLEDVSNEDSLYTATVAPPEPPTISISGTILTITGETVQTYNLSNASVISDIIGDFEASMLNDIFDVLEEDELLDDNIAFVQQLILSHPNTNDASIMFRDLPDSEVNGVIAFLYNQTGGPQRLANILIHSTGADRGINDIIDRLTETQLANVLQHVSDNQIANFFRYNAADNDSKQKLIDTIVNQNLTNTVLNQMNVGEYMRESMTKIITELGTTNSNVRTFLEDMVAHATSNLSGDVGDTNHVGHAALMFNQLATSFGEESGENVIDTLITAGKKLDIGLLMGGGTWNISASNVNLIMDHLQSEGELENVIDAMNINQWFSILDQEKMSDDNYDRFLNAIVAKGTNQEIMEFLLKPLNDNAPSYGNVRGALLAKLALADEGTKLTAVYNDSSTSSAEIAQLISASGIDNSALTRIGNALKEAGESKRLGVIDNLTFNHMERVVNRWSTDNTLNYIIDGVGQTQMNNWLDRLSLSWTTAPSVTGISDFTQATPSERLAYLQGGTAKTLISAATTQVQDQVLVSAYTQQALSTLATGFFDFSSPEAVRNSLGFLAGALVNDAATFLNILGAVASEMSSDVISEINRLLNINAGDRIYITNQGWATAPTGGNLIGTIAPGQNVSITMQFGTETITINTNMTHNDKVAVINRMLAAYTSGNVRADQIASVFTGISSYDTDNVEKRNATTLLMQNIIDNMLGEDGTQLEDTQRNAIIYALASYEKQGDQSDPDFHPGQYLIDTYILTDHSLHNGMLEGFAEYCLDQTGTNGAQILANVINTNFIDGSDFSNATLNLLLGDLIGLGTTQLNSVIDLLDDRALVSLLNEDDINNKSALRTSIIATKTPAELATFLQYNLPSGLNRSATEAMLSAIDASTTNLKDVLFHFEPSEVSQMLNKGTGVSGGALTSVFNALNDLADDSGSQGIRGSEIVAHLLTGNTMTKANQEHLLSRLSTSSLRNAIAKMTGAQVTSLIHKTQGHDTRIMEAAKFSLSENELFSMLSSLGVEGKDAFIGILNNTAISGKSLTAVLTGRSVNHIRNLVQTFGLSDTSLGILFTTAQSVLNVNQEIELLMLGDEPLSWLLKEKFLQTYNTSNLNNLVDNMADYTNGGEDGIEMLAMLINYIPNDDDLKTNIANAIASQLSAEQILEILPSIGSTETDLVFNALGASDQHAKIGQVISGLATSSNFTKMNSLISKTTNFNAVFGQMATAGNNIGLIFYNLSSANESKFNQAIINLYNSDSSAKQHVAQSLVNGLSADRVDDFSNLLMTLFDSGGAGIANMSYFGEAFEQSSTYLVAVAEAIISESGSNFTIVNALLANVNMPSSSLGQQLFQALSSPQAGGSFSSYLKESLVAMSIGHISGTNNVLGQLQLSSALYAIENSTDSSAIDSVFGEEINTDTIAIVAKELYESSALTAPQRESIVDNMLTGMVGFDFDARIESSPGAYFNNLKRIIFMSQYTTGENSLLEAMGSSDLVSSYINTRGGVQMLQNSITESLRDLGAQHQFIGGSTVDGFRINSVVLDELSLEEVDESGDYDDYSYAYPVSHRTLVLFYLGAIILKQNCYKTMFLIGIIKTKS